jgi:hypothetical protein
LGALYSLVSLAQENPSRRQTVVDVLCAYLRMPYTLPMPDDPNGQSTRRMLARRRAVNDERDRDATQERQVRQTAQRLLTDHLRPPPGTSGTDAQSIPASQESTFWPGISLDLTGATWVGHSVIVGPSLAGISVVHALFTDATFFGDVSFEGASFSGDVQFDGASFSRSGRFNEATFSGFVSFARATFSGYASFGRATFSGFTRFDTTNFSGGAWFAEATFAGEATFPSSLRGGAGPLNGVHILRPDDPELVSWRKWPDGWTVRRDPDDTTQGTLVFEE